MKKDHVRGIKSGIAPRKMRPRASRHGKPMSEAYSLRLSPNEIELSRNTVLRATSPTTSGWQKNGTASKKEMVK